MNESAGTARQTSQGIPSPPSLSAIRLIQAATGLGIAIFAAMVFFAHANEMLAGTPNGAANVELVGLLSRINIAAAAVACVLAWVVSKIAFKGPLLPDGVDVGEQMKNEAGLFKQFMAGFFKKRVLCLAFLYASAMVGTIACAAGATAGVMGEHPEYWLNLIPVGVFELYVAGTFPTRRGLEEAFRIRLDGPEL